MTTPTLALTADVVRQDGQNRVARTGAQAGLAGAIVIVAVWLAHQLGWHGDMPMDVTISWQIILTAAGSALTNLSKLRGRL